MTALDATKIVGLLAEDDRRAVAAALILGATSLNDLATATGLDTRAVTNALERLVSGGLVTSDGTSFWIVGQAFKVAARQAAPKPPETQFGNEPAADRKILDQWITDGRLSGLPTKWSHKVVLLDWVAQRFEPGIHYSEQQINATLATIYPDTAALRRYLVEANLMDRADGEYWRSGGTIR